MPHGTVDTRPAALNSAASRLDGAREQLMDAAKLADEAHAMALHQAIMGAVAAVDDATESARSAIEEMVS